MVDPVIIPDDSRKLDASNCVYPTEYEGHFDSLMISKEEIKEVVRSLAVHINIDYRGCRPVIVCVLKGANPFYQHLLDALQDCRQGFSMEFIRVSSYEGMGSTGNVKMGLLDKDLEGLKEKHVLLVEDIVDTGTTLSHLIPILKEKVNPASLEVCSLLSKRINEPQKCKAKYVGFSIPDHFIVGYGLDYNELYRDTKDIWIISQKGIDFDPSSLK
ncbi:MAG: hypoxanthine phosphoribosyltransferase [Bacillariaceae sp.]|jgi:hypoxanthine phosphoribosyltransferase